MHTSEDLLVEALLKQTNKTNFTEQKIFIRSTSMWTIRQPKVKNVLQVTTKGNLDN